MSAQVTATRTLPFDGFLEILRAKGYGVSLHEYTAVAVLLDRWDRTSVVEMADAIAAVVARNDDEVEGIRRLFLSIYAPPPPPRPLPPVRAPSTWLREHAWMMALAAAALLLAAIVVSWPARTASVTVSPVASVMPPVTTPANVDAVPLPPPPAPALPPPPLRVDRRVIGASLSGVFLLALAGFWSLKIREARRLWTRTAWASVRASLPGPFHFKESIHDLPAHLPKTDVDDAATLLGRVFSKKGLARELDVVRSLRETLRRGLMPTLITRPRRVAEPIVVFQDVCQEMGVWDGKVNGLLADLKRQGIVLQMFYFDGDLSRVSERPHRPAASLESVLRGRPDSPLLFISSGSGLAAALSMPDQGFIHLLRTRLRTAWLTPVSDVRLWPRELSSLPMSVWPMTHLGLVHAARQLAGMDADTSALVRERIASEGRVTREDIERLKRLASLVPYPTPRLLESLRHQFAADVPDSAVLHLMNEAEGPAAQIVRLSDADVRRCLVDIRHENPDLEIAAREAILAVLLDSEPAAGSAAHERWSIAVQLQRLQLADLAGSTEDAARAMRALEDLGQGPMGSEVQESLRLVPVGTPARQGMNALPASGRRLETPPSAERQRQAGVGPMRWSWPGLREIVPASIAAVLLLTAALGFNVLPANAVEHLRDAYTLAYAPVPSASTPQLALSLGPDGGNLPRQVDLYREDRVFRAGIPIGATGTTTVPLAADDTGAHFQVRATLPERNLAVSPWVWVTSDKLSFILIDASPWANVTITGGETQTAVQQTPFTAALLPGTYQVHFDNPTLGASSTVDQTLAVPAAGATLHITMPGFNPVDTVDSLLQRPTASKR